MATLPGLPGSHHANKITKPRNNVVKPILKKLSHSEKNSLDLDRGWEEQPISNGWGVGYDSTGVSRPARDVSFQIDYGDRIMFGGGGGHGGGGGPGGGPGGGAGRAKFHHARSASGTSHVSVMTNGSGHHHRVGSFVHPFQQTPRTSTPPLSYAASMASFDNARDYSPTITENEDDDEQRQSFSHSVPYAAASSSMSQSGLRRPSLASQRTDSLSDITAPPAPQLRVNTTTARSISGPSSRLAHGVLSQSYSQSDLHLNLTSPDSPTPTTAAAVTTTPTLMSPVSSSTSPMAPLRSSLDSVGFRLRSRSEVDAASKREEIREARRKFEERERLKEEKYAREQVRKRERKDSKEASRIEKAAASARHERKNTGGSSKSDPVIRPPPAPRKISPTSLSGSVSEEGGAGEAGRGGGKMKKHRTGSGCAGGRNAAGANLDEKQLDFVSRNYDSVPGGATPSFGPGVDGVQFRAPTRRSTAKRKTQGYWTGFILWFRTRLLRLGRR
ncbi:hypothetical protein NKR23_g3892 [Pleurostoma richardsiae]|uniref:Uncharacterized protein n=1 Tax=Pleurostoma richardsiae TaxID=41990 RepID=A0AA38VT16_9PEZI|nr:hypothetical protein NKR23_g3892 [Pleurostoma richardsiae]